MPDVTYVELIQSTRFRWLRLSEERRADILQLGFISRMEGYRFYFIPEMREKDVKEPLRQALLQLVRSAETKYFFAKEPRHDRFAKKLLEPGAFKKLSFGSDVAEHDSALHNYFISTKSFQLVSSGQKSIVIGPKGSGKSAILSQLASTAVAGYTVIITPEVFATSMLRKFVEDSEGVWDEDEAFVSTWIFTIFVEVFKRICEKARGIPERSLRNLRAFLYEHAEYRDLDLFTRFIGYLKEIQSIKLGAFELTVKTRMLQDLYSLESVYRLIPDLRVGLKDDVLIVVDELDQGWDNSPHSNRFIGSLLQAAVRIQRLSVRARVVVLIRSEIFDLVKYQLDQLDKLRSSIDMLKWTPDQLAGLVLKRVDYSIGTSIEDVEKDLALISYLCPESCRGTPGFNYLVSRTTLRPREVLQFLRHAHQIALDSGAKAITANCLLKAEEEFSSWKMEHLCSEYKYIYPGLKDVLWAFRSYGPVLSGPEVFEILRHYVDSIPESDRHSWVQIPLRELVQKLYDIDFIGVNRPSRSKSGYGLLADYEFSYERPSANAKGARSFLIHPSLWACLEVPTS